MTKENVNLLGGVVFAIGLIMLCTVLLINITPKTRGQEDV